MKNVLNKVLKRKRIEKGEGEPGRERKRKGVKRQKGIGRKK